jgi:hypothetical protein
MKLLRSLEKLETRETPAVLTGSDLPPAELPQPIELPPAEMPQPIAQSPLRIIPPAYVLGASSGSQGRVRTINRDGSVRQDFLAFYGKFNGEVHAVLGDVNGDGVKDIIVGAGAGGGPRVQVWDGATTYDYFDGEVHAAVVPKMHHDFFAFDQSFNGGVSLASADVDGDGADDIIVGAGAGGGPHVKVFSGKTGELLEQFFAFQPGYSGGMNLAASDLTNDGKADIVVGSNGGMQATVAVFNGATSTQIRSITPYANFTGAVNVAVAENNYQTVNLVAASNRQIITAAGVGGGPHVKVYTVLDNIIPNPVANTVSPTIATFPTSLELEPVVQFMAYDPSFSGGVSLATADVNFDGMDEIITGAGVGGAPHIREFNSKTGTLLGEYLAPRVNPSDPWYNAGVKLGS